MKQKFLSFQILLLLVLALPLTTSAQLQLPQASPGASVTQTIGLTDITIEYSSPGVKGREIWGKLVPFDKIWRTGANAATKISFSKDVMVEGNKVPKGKYSIFTIPAATSFTVIFNKDINATTDSYKQSEDLFRIVVKTQPCEFRERMTFMFSNFNESQTNVDLEWDKLRVTFNIKADTENQAIDNIDKEIAKSWRTYNSAARYYLETLKNKETAMKYVDQSIALKEDWQNDWTKAQVLAAMDNKTEAYKWAVKAKDLGDKSDNFFSKEQVEKALVDWKTGDSKKNKK